MEHADNRMVSSGERYRGKDILGKTPRLESLERYGISALLPCVIRNASIVVSCPSQLSHIHHIVDIWIR